MNTAHRLVVLATLALSAHGAHAALIFQESFEGGGAYSVENGGFNPAFNNRFFTTLPQGGLTLGYTPANIDGAGYFGGRDLNGFTSATPHRVTFSAVDVSAYQNVMVTIALSARAGSIFEGGDVITLEVSLDGGVSFTALDHFAGQTGGAALSNGTATLNESLVDYSYSLLGSPSQLVFRIGTDDFIASDEAIAFDNFRVTGDARAIQATVAEPASLMLVGAGLLSLLTAARSRALRKK